MRRFLCFALVLAAAGSAGAASFSDTVAAYRAPALAGSAHRVTGATVEVANATLTLDGVVTPLASAGATVGLVFTGDGSIAVRVADGPFAPGNRVALDEVLGAKPEGGVVRKPFTRAVLLSAELPAAVLEGEELAVPADHAAILKDRLDRVADSWYGGIDHHTALYTLNGKLGPHLFALLDGGGEDLVYSADPVFEQDEVLASWKKFKVSGPGPDWYVEQALLQPFGYDPKVHPAHPYVQTEIDVEIVSTDNEQVSERTTTTVVAGRDGLQVIPLGLLNGRSGSPRFWNEHEAPFTVTSVVDVAGEPLEFSHRYDQLLVKAPQPLRRGQPLTFTVKAEGKLLKNFSGDSYLVLGNMSWFPQVDLYHTAATFHSVVKVKDPYIAIGCGRNVRRWTEEGGLNCLETEEKRRIAFPFVVVGKFEQFSESKGGFDLKVYSYAMAKERGGKKLLQNGLAALDFYSSGMEPFPYGELEVVEIPYFRHFFWQSPAGIVEITSEGFNPAVGDDSDIDSFLRRIASRGQNSRYAHEIAHQWFGNLVGFETSYDNWISESFSEYLSYMFMSEGAKEKRLAKDQLVEWRNSTKECADKATVYGAEAVAGAPRSGGCYTALLYGKGPLVLHALRDEIGDEAFNKVLYFVTTAAAKKEMKVVTEDLIQIVNAVTQKDYRPFFDRYIFGTEVPEI